MNESTCPQRHGWGRRAALALGCFAAAWSVAGHAESVAADTEYFRGTQTATSTFAAPGAGTLTVNVYDLDWPSALSSLSFSVTNATSVMGTLTKPGTLEYDVTGPGMYTAVISGAAGNNPFGLGAYSFNVQFTSAVPLPPSVILLLSGLGALGAAVYGRRPLASLIPRQPELQAA
jgi:hypothetical protein